MHAEMLIKSQFKMSIFLLLVCLFAIPTYGDTTHELSLMVGESKSIYAMEDGQMNTFDSVSYKSISESVAQVSKKGVVTGISPGQTSIEIYVLKNGHVENAYVNVNVTSDFKGLTLPTSEAILVGEVYKVQYELERRVGVADIPENIIWNSSNLAVADVDAYGNVYPYASGRTVITAQTRDGVYTDSISLIITPNDIAERLVVNNGFSKVLRVGDVFTPLVSKVSDREITNDYEILNLTSDKVEVIGHEIKAINSGEAKLVYIDKSTMASAVFDLRIYSTVAGISLRDDILTYENIGEKHTLIYTLISDEMDEVIEKGVNWYSSNSSVVAVDDGIITTMGYGTAEVVAETVDGQHRDNIFIYVHEPEKVIEDVEYTWINLEQPESPTFVGAEIPLVINTDPVYESLEGFSVNVSQGSSDQVEKRNGVFYFVPDDPGRFILYARTPNGRVAQASVYVRTMLADVEISDDMITVVKDGEKAMYVGEKIALKASVETAGSLVMDEVNRPELEWTSSNPTVVEVQGNYIIAHHVGETTLQVKTKDGSYSDEMEIGVYPTVIDFKLPENVVLHVGQSYIPQGEFRTIYRFDKPIIDTFEIELTGVYFSKVFIESQIAYFSERKKDIMNNRYNDALYLREVRAYETLISLYEELLDNGRKDYYLVSDTIKNKILDDIPFVEIGDGVVSGLRDGKVDLKLMSLDNEQERPMSIIFEGDDEYNIQIISQDGVVLFNTDEE